MLLSPRGLCCCEIVNNDDVDDVDVKFRKRDKRTRGQQGCVILYLNNKKSGLAVGMI